MRNSKLIEIYEPDAVGFQSVLIQDSWQVGQLNYSLDHDLDHFSYLEANLTGDQSLSLLIGKAVLLTIEETNGTEYEIVLLKRGTSYNIPQGKQYQVIMTNGSKIFMVEKALKSLKNHQKFPLNIDLLKMIRQSIRPILKS
ncbi:MAG: hypothetical protein AAF985_14420 [Bacteroidota bacterium]